MNTDVALEANLSFFHEEVPLSIDPFYTPDNHLFSNPDGSENLMLHIKLNNFINFSAQKEDKGTPQYIGKGRQILGGDMWFWKRKEYSWKTNYRFSPQFSQFITNKLMLKGDFSFFRDENIDPSQVFTAGLSARYYLPFRNRLFFYPSLSLSTTNNSDYSNLGMSIGFGSSYFLSENIALDATLFQLRAGNGGPLSNLIGVGNIGLLYFIR
jgi:hypothetical protein